MLPPVLAGPLPFLVGFLIAVAYALLALKEWSR